MARVDVDPAQPHRIVTGYASPCVPDYLAPGLPSSFLAGSLSREPAQPPRKTARFLTIFSGVPGTGKSTIADRLGAVLNVPVFALDWVLGALTPFGLRHRSDLIRLGEELLVTLAYRQLKAGGSAIIDTTTEAPTSRHRFESLAGAFGARFESIVCFCSNPDLHRERAEQRQRNIPGWHDAADWQDVQDRLARFAPWPGSHQIDTAGSLDHCVIQAIAATSIHT